MKKISVLLFLILITISVLGEASYANNETLEIDSRSIDDGITEQKLLASDGAKWDIFGRAVSGDYTIGSASVGASNSPQTVIVKQENPNSANNNLNEQKLLSSDGRENDCFGRAVSISGDYAIVGAGISAWDSATDGYAYIFKIEGDTVSKINILG